MRTEHPVWSGASDRISRYPAAPCQRAYLSSLAVLALALADVQCAARAAEQRALPSSPSEQPGQPSAAERFLPLVNDTVYSYAAWLPESPDPEQLILQVDRPSAGRANLRSGSSVKRLEIVADGVRLVSGGYLLKPPLHAGASWTGPAGRVQVSAVEQAVRVAAGEFVGCLETTERDAARSRMIVTTYCPKVGIVRFSVDDGERRERFELKSFGPRVDVNSL